MVTVAAAQEPVDLLAGGLASTTIQPVTQQPDIEYHPNAEQYKARTARRLAKNPSLAKSTLPEGFPQKVESPLVWEGKDFKGESEWVYGLTPDQLGEIDDAVKHFRCEYAFTWT